MTLSPFHAPLGLCAAVATVMLRHLGRARALSPPHLNWPLLAGAVLLALTLGCAPEEAALKDGYYTAEAADFNDQGWKEFLTIYVNNGTIVTAEYNARNASGFVNSWDMDARRARSRAGGVQPHQYARAFTVALLNRQDPGQVQSVPGAERAHLRFQKLAEAAIAQARAGDKMVAFVDLPDAD